MHVGLELLPDEPHGLVGHKVAAAVSLRDQFEKALALHVAKRGLPGIQFSLLDILARDFASAQHRLPRAVGAFQRMAADRRPDARNLDARREARFTHGLTDRPHGSRDVHNAAVPDARRRRIADADHAQHFRLIPRTGDKAEHLVGTDIKGGEKFLIFLLLLHGSLLNVPWGVFSCASSSVLSAESSASEALS